MIVDDNMIFTQRMVSLLYDVNCIRYINIASDYNEACFMIKDEMPDLVLLDINLPGKNGIEFLKHLRQMDKKCSVIVLTNHTDEHYRSVCKQNGAEEFLDKSNDFERVPGIINRLHG